jgi:hypothetical protein
MDKCDLKEVLSWIRAGRTMVARQAKGVNSRSGLKRGDEQKHRRLSPVNLDGDRY